MFCYCYGDAAGSGLSFLWPLALCYDYAIHLFKYTIRRAILVVGIKALLIIRNMVKFTVRL